MGAQPSPRSAFVRFDSSSPRSCGEEQRTNEAPRVVVLTTRTNRGAQIIAALRDRRIAIHAIVVDRGQLSGATSMKRTRTYARRGDFGQIRTRVARRILRSCSPRRKARRAGWRTRAAAGDLDVFEVADPNSDTAVRLLAHLAPDLVVLGTTRILDPELLGIPRLGVLNAHPGLLPQYRGVDVIAWALHNGHPMGVTVHFVDPGIDTGRIVAQRRLAMRQGDTLAALKRRAGVVAAQKMADCVHRLIDTGCLESRCQQPGVGRTYTRMPPKTLREVEAAVTAMAGAGTDPR